MVAGPGFAAGFGVTVTFFVTVAAGSGAPSRAAVLVTVTAGAGAAEPPVPRELRPEWHSDSPTQALAQATVAANTLEARLTSPDAHALLGELHLISATSLTQDRQRPGNTRAEDVRGHLAEAAKLAGRTGETRAWHLNFGPTNVGIHKVSLNTDLGLHGVAVTAGDGVHPETLAEAPGRQAAFHADLGRSLAHLRGREAQAVAALLTAEQTAPQRIHANAPVRNTVEFLIDRQLPAHAARDLRGLAHRIGLPL